MNKYILVLLLLIMSIITFSAAKPKRVYNHKNNKLNSEFDNIYYTIEHHRPVSYIDRGDPAAYDFAVSDFTTDGTWRDLDLSAIVPAGAKAVVLLLLITDNAAGSQIVFRKNGNTNANVWGGALTQVANLAVFSEVIVACDTDRIIEYSTSNLTFTQISLTVKGYFK